MKTEILSKLKKEFKNYNSALVAFSGGVDSTLLLFLLKKILGNNVKAATVVFPYIPSKDIEKTKTLAKLIGVQHHFFDGSNIFKNKNFRLNPRNRCYICKKHIYEVLKRFAEKEKISVIVDGTNFDDLKEDRPGLKALEEENIKTPLADLGLDKKTVRLLAKQFNLPNWNSPPTTCLLTRLPFGTEITADKLSRIEKAESFLASVLGEPNIAIRVRDYMDIAVLEVSKDHISKVFLEKAQILKKFKELGFKKVALDLEGYYRF